MTKPREPLARFWEKVDTDGDCWVWLANKDRHGYGLFYAGPDYPAHTKMVRPHRFIFEAVNGAIPPGMTVDHLCFNPSCVYPAHLRLLSASENASRRQSLDSDTCTRGHQRTPENTRIRPDERDPTRTRRRCIDCERIAVKRSRAKRESVGGTK